ncbi:hypothetical protein ACM66B_003028 [Microbotryomycetes sp. NB124-2]
MVFKLQRPRLSVTLLSDTLFLHPPPPGEQGQDELLRGIIQLELPSARKIEAINIELKGIGSLTADHTHIQFPTLRQEVRIDLSADDKLEAGTHEWSWTLVVPSSTAIQERCAYGSIRHLLRAWCVEPGTWAQIEADALPVFLVSSPCDRGEVPEGLEVDVRQPSKDLGQINLRVSAPHLTVAALVYLQIAFDSPPQCEVLSVSAFIIQSFKIDYPDKRLQFNKPPRQKKLLFYADQTTTVPQTAEQLLDRENVGPGASLPASYESRHRRPKPLARLEAGTPWSFARLVRILDDDRIRPSTLAHVDTPLRVSHKLVVEVKYRMTKHEQPRTLECSKSISIASCCCMQESLLLPSYVRERPKDKPRAFHQRCLCAQPLQTLVNREGASLASADDRSQSRERRPPPSAKLAANSSGPTSSTAANALIELGRRLSRQRSPTTTMVGSSNSFGATGPTRTSRETHRTPTTTRVR